jgi:hypothetical protein
MTADADDHQARASDGTVPAREAVLAFLTAAAERYGWPRILQCAHCGATLVKSASAINRAQKAGARLFCGHACVGAAKRLAPEVKKAMKAEYDRQRRAALGEKLKAQKRAAYYANHAANLAKATEWRRTPQRREYHNAYCRRPAYAAVKSQYDRQRRARLQFDEFADSFLLLQDLEREIDTRANRYEVYMQNGTINKAQTRKRALS